MSQSVGIPSWLVNWVTALRTKRILLPRLKSESELKITGFGAAVSEAELMAHEVLSLPVDLRVILLRIPPPQQPQLLAQTSGKAIQLDAIPIPRYPGIQCLRYAALQLVTLCRSGT